MQLDFEPWWKIDNYSDASTIPEQLTDETLHGPLGPALVAVYGDGKTTVGWGREQFGRHYKAGVFKQEKILKEVSRGTQAYAWVTRGSRLLVIDIDGKNGGFDGVKELGFLRPTLAERSKSGNGFHLFYAMSDDWDPKFGFEALNDVIGLVPGVDVRTTGCVYHYPQQRWNSRELIELPAHLDNLLVGRKVRFEASRLKIKKTLQGDPLEVVIMQNDLLEQLAKPIPAGKRNTTLFALGSQMKEAEIEDWENQLIRRGEELNMEDHELTRIVANVHKYA